MGESGGEVVLLGRGIIFFPMSTVLEIQEAISKLSPEEYAELMAALMDFAEDDWDREMTTDADSGRLDFLVF